jgi:putative redox protein
MPERPVDTATAAGGETGGAWVSARIGASGFRVVVDAGSHTFVVDEPVAVGGTDAGPTPYDYLLGALSGCMAITLRMYADRKGWPLEGVRVQLRTTRTHAPDCETCETQPVGITRLDRNVELLGRLTDEQRQRLMRIADRCPVKQTLQRGLKMVGEA